MAQPSPTPSGTATPTPTANLEALDFGHPNPISPRPFKSHQSQPSKPRASRRNKNLKQILQDEQKALAAQAAETAEPNTNGNTKASVKGRSGRTLRVEGLQWSDIDAPPSLLPQKKYCDITGLEGKYTDPKTKLKYHNSEVYAVIQSLPASIDQEAFPTRPQVLTLVFGIEERKCSLEVGLRITNDLAIPGRL
jgi:INO80 complex subunit C